MHRDNLYPPRRELESHGVDRAPHRGLRHPDLDGAGFEAVQDLSDDVGGRPAWFYLLALLGDAQPWVMLVPLAALRARRAADRSAPALIPWLAAAFPLLPTPDPGGLRADRRGSWGGFLERLGPALELRRRRGSDVKGVAPNTSTTFGHIGCIRKTRC